MRPRSDAITVALGVLMVAYGTNVSTPFLATYRDRLDLGPSATQFIFVVYVIGILAMLFVAGQMSDRFGRRRMLVPSLLLTAAGSALFIVGRNNYALILIGRILLGAASGAALGVGAAWIQELMGRGSELRAAFITTIVTYAGFGIGPPISTIWDRWLPNALVWPFGMHIVASLAIIPLVLRCRETVDVEAAATASSGPWRPQIRFGVPEDARRRFWWLLAPFAVLVFAFPSTGFSLFPLLVAESYDGSDVLLTGVAGILTPWAGLIARPYLSRVSANSGLFHGAILGTVGYLLGTLAWSQGWWPLVWVAAACLGGASGVISTSGLTLVGEMTDDATRGALSSTFYLLAYAGMTMPLMITGLSAVIGTGATLTIVCVAAGLVTASTPWRRRVAT